MSKSKTSRIDRRPAAWQQHITAQRQSGLSASSYCREHQLTASNFYYWRKKLGTAQPVLPTASEEAHWLPITLPDAASPADEEGSSATRMVIDLTLPGGIHLRIGPA